MRILTGVAALSFVVASLAGTPADADTYKRDNLIFDIPDIPPDQVEEQVISALTYFGQKVSGDDPALLHWTSPACYRADSAGDANREKLKAVLESIGLRVALQISGCGDTDGPGIAYYFAEGELTPDDRDAAQAFAGKSSKLFSTFLDGSLPCYWKYKVPNVAEAAIGSAIVVVNVGTLDEEGARRCLFLGTIAALGIVQPAGINDDDPDVLRESAEAWKRNAELNLLTVYLLPLALNEIDPKEATASVSESVVRRLVESMHQIGQ
jgi:hypothetical protein